MAVIKIKSDLENAVTLRVYEMMEDPGQHAFFPNQQGMMTARRKGDAVKIEPGTATEVDADFWREWREQNKGGGLLTSGALREEKADEAEQESVR